MESLLSLVRDSAGPWALFGVFAGALLEYLLPPLPADSVVFAGALLVVSGAYAFGTVFVVAALGGMLGAAVHYAIGRRLSEQGLKSPRVQRIVGEGSAEKFSAAFRRHGLWVVVINRALPGVRGVTFLAAGAVRLPFARTMLAGLVSHAAWIFFILFVGVRVGESWEKIQATFAVYQKVVYAVAGTGALAYVGFRLWRRRRRAADETPEESDR